VKRVKESDTERERNRERDIGLKFNREPLQHFLEANGDCIAVEANQLKHAVSAESRHALTALLHFDLLLHSLNHFS
jgi:hypothetical protein